MGVRSWVETWMQGVAASAWLPGPSAVPAALGALTERAAAVPGSLKLPQPLGLRGAPGLDPTGHTQRGCHDNLASSLAQVLEFSAPSPWLRD